MQDKEKQKPIRVTRCGGLKAAVWLSTTNKDGKDVNVPRIRIQKSYKDRNTGEWVNTDWLYLDDLPKVVAVATEAYRHFRVFTRDLESGNASNGNSPTPEPEDDSTMEEPEE